MKTKTRSGSTQPDTHSKRSAKDLLMSEKNFANILDNISDGVYWLNTNGYFIYVNNVILKRSGMSRDQFYTLHFLDIVDPEFHEKAKTNFQRVMKGEDGIPYELRYKSFNGQVRIVEVNSRPVSEGEKIVGLLGVSRDITGRKRIEEALQERIKELNGLYSITAMIAKADSMEDIFQGAANLMPYSWSYPEVACIQITLGDQEFKTENFQETLWKLSADITVRDQHVGVIEVCYLEERPKADEGPFLKEERHLLDAIADLLGGVIERKRAEVALREGEQLFRTLTERSLVGIYVVQNGLFQLANPNAASYAGYTPEDLMGTKSNFIVHPEDKEIQRKGAIDMLKGKRTFPCEFRIICRNGEIRWIMEIVTPIIYKGNPAILGNSMDITEYKQAEENLKASEKQFRNLIESVDVGIFTYEGTKFRYLNPAFEKITGYTRDELYLTDVWEIVHTEFKDSVREYVHKRQMGEPVPELHLLKIITKSGEERWVERGAIPIELRGKPSILITVMDITERRRTEEALRKSEEKYRAILENASDAILVADEHGNLIEANRMAESFFGYPREELLQMHYTQLHPMMELEDSAAAFNDMVTHGKGCLQNGKILRKDGTVVPVDITATAIKYGDRKVLQGSFRDISEHKRTEDKLEGLVRERTAELSKKNKQLVLEINERKHAEASLRKKAKELHLHSGKLQEMNAALKVLLKQREEDKRELEEKVMANVKELLLPYLEELKTSRLDPRGKVNVSIIEANLNSIISPFTHKLSSKYSGFTPREIQVANLIRQGRSTKDIAEFMGISLSAINIYRNHIRNKLGITTKKINLRSHLMTLS
jgi:PAS domain S-box-containing protein